MDINKDERCESCLLLRLSLFFFGVNKREKKKNNKQLRIQFKKKNDMRKLRINEKRGEVESELSSRPNQFLILQ